MNNDGRQCIEVGRQLLWPKDVCIGDRARGSMTTPVAWGTSTKDQLLEDGIRKIDFEGGNCY